MIPEKMALELLTMRSARSKMRRSSFARRYSQRGVIDDRADKPVRVIVMIECDEDANFAHLAAFGIRVNQERGHIRTAFLPLRLLGRLSDETTIHRISPSETLATAMDLAGDSVALPAFRTATNLTGQGVIIGFVDTGFDPRHPALRRRILRAWDQLPHGNGVGEGGYGVELRGQPLEQELRDLRGHGTHVAGIAAGAGLRFQGVAPGADFILVRSDLNEAHIIDGIQYIFRVAAEMEQPAVINLSVASPPGPYDGSDPLCQKIDALTGPGRIVCCAAGNHGGQRSHAQVTLLPDTEVIVPFRLSTGLREVQVRAAYRKQNRLSLAMGLANGEISTFVSSSANRQDFAPGIFVDFHEPAAESDFAKLTITMSSTALRTAGSWHLVLRGEPLADGRVDLWLRGIHKSGQIVTQDALGFAAHVDDSMKIGTPGAAASTITVASYTTRREWRTGSGELHTRDVPLREISPFSSPGPLVDGRRKPDVAAPGAWIVSAQASEVQAESDLRIDSAHALRDGTSMAAAFISGVVALLLERDPTLDPPRVKQLLWTASTIPGLGSGIFDPRWGWGLPDLSRLL